MSTNLYVSSSEALSGKSLVVLGIMELLSRRVQKLGFFRPIVKDASGKDNDTELLLSRYSLSQTREESFGTTLPDAVGASNRSGTEALVKQILRKYKALESRCDFVLCEGTDFEGVTSAFEFDLNAQLANHIGAPVINVLSGGERSTRDVIASIRTTRGALREQGCKIIGTMVNRLTPVQHEELAGRLAECGEEPVFLILDEPLLDAPTVGAVLESLDGELIQESTAGLDREILHFTVAAMHLPSFLERVGEASLIITPGDRSDILLGTLAAAASETFPRVSGIALSGGIMPAESVRRLMQGVRRPDIPIFSVATDTYETVRDVQAVTASISAGNERKIQTALGLFETCVDTHSLADRIDAVRTTVVTPSMFEFELIERAKAQRQKIVLPEGEEERILQAAESLRRRDVVDLVLLGREQKIQEMLGSLGIDPEGLEILEPSRSEHLEDFANQYYQLRKHKGLNPEQAHDLVQSPSFFGTMMVYRDLADGMVSGAVHTTADTIRPALQIIRTQPDCSIVSSVFLMCLKDRVLVYGDCAVNPNPTPPQLADIAISSAATAEMFGIEPRVAMLSYSTGASGSGEDVENIREATRLVRDARPELLVEGPIQYDAAIDARVAKTKLPESQVAGKATVFVFPDLNTGNNTYKAVQRSASAVAIGPVLQGLKKPVNDLSRGCTVTDIVNTVAITAIQAQRQ